MRIGRRTSRMITRTRYMINATLMKYNSGSYVDGMYQSGVEEETVVKVNKQPATSDDRANMPPNSNIEEAIRIYIPSTDRDLIRPVRIGDTVNTNGDVFVIDNIRYEVYTVDNRTENNHIKCICMRQDNQDG